MSFTGTLPSLKRGLMHNNHSDLPEKFKYNDLQKREVIGRGSYGLWDRETIFLCCSDLNNFASLTKLFSSFVDDKIIVGESTEDENNFVRAQVTRNAYSSNIAFSGTASVT